MVHCNEGCTFAGRNCRKKGAGQCFRRLWRNFLLPGKLCQGGKRPGDERAENAEAAKEFKIKTETEQANQNAEKLSGKTVKIDAKRARAARFSVL